VVAFQALSDTEVLVLGSDGKLWLEHGPFGNVPPPRQQVDGNIAIGVPGSSGDTPGSPGGLDSGGLDFSFNPIVFGGGVPVGGWSNLTVRQDGTYTFSGHFHDSGATQYNMALIWAVKDSRNIIYTFEHKGQVAGTFESGSRDDDWSEDGQTMPSPKTGRTSLPPTPDKPRLMQKVT
jgi:hypothetical protein